MSKTRVPEVFLRFPQVAELTGLKRSAWYARVLDGRAPSPIKLGRAAVWPLVEIEAWIRGARETRCEPAEGTYGPEGLRS